MKGKGKTKEGIERSKEAFQKSWKLYDIRKKIREMEREENPRIRTLPREALK